MNLLLSFIKHKLLHYLILSIFIPQYLIAGEVNSEKYTFHVEEIVSGLSHPWGLAFLPNGNMLVTERTGDLRIIENLRLRKQAISGLPKIKQRGQGGLLDIALHPDFENNQTIYLSYAGINTQGLSTEVLRGRLEDYALKNIEVIFQAEPKTSGGRHFGGRLVFDNQGYLYISLGDRGDQDRAQELDNHIGTLIRLHANGSLPSDNPFVGDGSVKPEIYSYGHRNIQGATKHPETGKIWLHEHGPQGGDEINISKPGINYGWPVITYGVNYGLGTKIGLGTQKEGLEQPIYHWTPSIAPSGMTFYTGNEFPDWRDNLFVGSLKFGLLLRLVIKDNQVVHEERMLDKKYGRIRDVRQGPDGTLYLLTDERNGAVLRLSNMVN